MAVAVSGLVIVYFAFAVDPAGNDRHGASATQGLADGVGVVPFVGKQVSGTGRTGQEQASGLDVRNVAWRQVEGVGPAEEVRERVDFGGLAAARRADRLVFRPPFPPWAERWAFT